MPSDVRLEFFSLDLTGRFIGFSSGLCELLGIGQGLAADTMLANILSPSGDAAGESLQRMLIASTLEDGQASASVNIPGEAGPRQAQLKLSLLRNLSGEPISILATCRAVVPSASALPTVGVRVTQTGASSDATQVRQVDGQDFIIASPLMHKFMGLVERVAGHTETVLITGETGVGKELVARSIHHFSHRRAQPWVDINCAALPDHLVESELFGYEKGAFSGADGAKAGMFELADNGTLFLDEIGELQLQTQVKLLRVLDGQPFYRLGGSRKIHVDVRVVAATNQDLEAAVEKGRFRRDLYHRLSQFHLRVPALRERPEDIAVLAERALAAKVPPRTLTMAALDGLRAYSWPGNIRELRNILSKVCVESADSQIDWEQIADELRSDAVPASSAPSALNASGCDLESVEAQAIRKALEQTGGHRTRAAEKLGISRRTLTRKLKDFNFDSPHAGAGSLGSISLEQQKFFRARVDLAATIRNARGEQASVQAVNLSTGGMGLDGVPPAMRTASEIEVSFPLPDSGVMVNAGARIVWAGEGGRVGVHFTRMEPAYFEQLQVWTKQKMKEEGWELPA
jgi:DNA-binding NtrC family response regulator